MIGQFALPTVVRWRSEQHGRGRLVCLVQRALTLSQAILWHLSSVQCCVSAVICVPLQPPVTDLAVLKVYTFLGIGGLELLRTLHPFTYTRHMRLAGIILNAHTICMGRTIPFSVLSGHELDPRASRVKPPGSELVRVIT